MNKPYPPLYADNPQVAPPVTPALDELIRKLDVILEDAAAADRRLANALMRAIGNGPRAAEDHVMDTVFITPPQIDALNWRANEILVKLASISINLNHLDTLV